MKTTVYNQKVMGSVLFLALTITQTSWPSASLCHQLPVVHKCPFICTIFLFSDLLWIKKDRQSKRILLLNFLSFCFYSVPLLWFLFLLIHRRLLWCRTLPQWRNVRDRSRRRSVHLYLCGWLWRRYLQLDRDRYDRAHASSTVKVRRVQFLNETSPPIRALHSQPL